MVDPVTVADGKYTFFIDEDGLLNCLRHGEPWPAFRERKSHLSGCQLALYHDLLNARQEQSELFLLQLIDVVWGVAYEDESVPSTAWARRMIAKARETYDPSQLRPPEQA